MSHVLIPGECPECDLMPKEIATLKARVAELEAALRDLAAWVDWAGSEHAILCSFPGEKMSAARNALAAPGDPKRDNPWLRGLPAPAAQGEPADSACWNCEGVGTVYDPDGEKGKRNVPCPTCRPRACAEFTAPAAPVAPAPEPAPRCERCGGTGKLTLGSREIDCPYCVGFVSQGTGRRP